VAIAGAQPGYVAGHSFAIFACQYCDLQFASPAIVPAGLYDAIYENVADLPGYSRYARWRSLIKSEADPLAWLARKEPAFHFLRVELLRLPTSSRVLEVGCGLGYLGYAIRSAGFEITCLDISEDAVAKARASFGDFYQAGDLQALAREASRPYDVVIACELIEHVEDPLAFLGAMTRLVRPGGTLLVTTPNKSAAGLASLWLTELPPVHLWWFSETAIRTMARSLGLSVRFFDFTAMNLGHPEPPDPIHAPSGDAWLDETGAITPAARRWMSTRDRQIRRKAAQRRLLGGIWPYLQRLKRKASAASLALEKSGTMGIVLTKDAARATRLV